MFPVLLFRLGLVCGLILLVGCQSAVMEKRLFQMIKANKAPSLDAWFRETKMDADLLKSVAANTGILLNGWESVEVASRSLSNDRVSATIQCKAKGESVYGSAVPITEDGYFLTAKHCLAGPSPRILVAAVIDGASVRVAKAPYRVVWSAVPEDVDVALIHAPLRPFQRFTFAPADQLVVGRRVAAAGWSGLKEGQAFSGMAAGKILKVSSVQEGADAFSWRVLDHDVPLDAGDSGGPLVDRYGRLAGVNCSASTSLFSTLFGLQKRMWESYEGTAVMPGVAFLQTTIDRDRTRQRGGDR